MICLGRWDDLGAGGRATRVAGCLLTSRVACWLPEWPVGYQSGLLATRVACWQPEWPVGYQSGLWATRVACWLPEWPVGYQSGLLANQSWPVGYLSGMLAIRVACWLPELVCWLLEWPVGNQSGLLATRVGVSWIRWSRTRIWTWSCGALGTTAYHGHDDGVGFRHDE